MTARSEEQKPEINKLAKSRIYAISLGKGLILLGLLYAGIRGAQYALPKYFGFSIPVRAYGLIYGLLFALCMGYVLTDYKNGVLKQRDRPEREKEA
ncbi:MAG: hypothetical protein ACJ8R9_30670 [Steroidobacteraceae bacterium]